MTPLLFQKFEEKPPPSTSNSTPPSKINHGRVPFPSLHTSLPFPTFYRTFKIQKTGTRRWQFQCQGIMVSQTVLDLLWKHDTNLSCRCRVSSRPWKHWNESSGLWKLWIVYDTLTKTLKVLKYAFLGLSWRPWNLPSRK